jgi:hypothetical protein
LLTRINKITKDENKIKSRKINPEVRGNNKFES